MPPARPPAFRRLLWPLLRQVSWPEWRAHLWRQSAAWVAVALGVALGLSVHLVNEAALGEFGAAVRSANGQPDASLRCTPACDDAVYAQLAALPQVSSAHPVLSFQSYVLKPGGHFIFSCETAEEHEADLVLRPTGRYAHKQSAVEQLCLSAGFAYVHVEPLPNLRLEGGVPQKGYLVVARKAAV